jgi:restriction system protein
MAKRKNDEGAQFVNYFGPLLDALRKLGGSGTPDEVVEQIARTSGYPMTFRIKLSSGGSRCQNQVVGHAST